MCLLFKGERVCVKCERQALRKDLGYRCAGHGVEDRATRWTALSAAHCHGKWIRLEGGSSVQDASCPTCKKGPDYIFVWNKDTNYSIFFFEKFLFHWREEQYEWMRPNAAFLKYILTMWDFVSVNIGLDWLVMDIKKLNANSF